MTHQPARGPLALVLVAATAPAALAEQWEGQWFNDTFMSEGTFAFDLSVVGTDVTITIDVDGNVFGGPDPDPIAITGTLDGMGNTTFSGGNPPLYDAISGGRQSDGTLSIDLANAGGFFPLVEIRGTWGATMMSGTYVIYSAGLPGQPPLIEFANGRFIGNLVPAPGAMAALGLAGLTARRRRR